MESMNTQTQFYPGMLGSEIEFFKTPKEVKILTNGKVSNFSEVNLSVKSILKKFLNALPKEKTILESWFPDDIDKQLETFVSCRFGGLDYTPDLFKGQLQDGEYHPCPKRGKCTAEGILCKLPIYNNERLTIKQVKLMRLLTTTDTNEVIAEKLGIPMGSYHLLKKNLYALLKVQTKQEVTLLCTALNLV